MFVTPNLPFELYTVAQIRQLESFAIVKRNVLGYTLMQRAAVFAHQLIKDHWTDAGEITILCGGGNNAGDGYVLAHLLEQVGRHVRIYYIRDPKTLKGDVAQAYKNLEGTAIQIQAFRADLKKSDLIVDALCGIGLSGKVDDKLYKLINYVNNLSVPVLAIDIPSGLNADTGGVMRVALKADVTATFIGLKQGMFTNDGPDYCGKVFFSDLGVSLQDHENLRQSVVKRLQFDPSKKLLNPRSTNSHKSHFGSVLVIGGNHGYLGAACMVAEAALRVGAGRVSIATRADHAGLMSVRLPEVMSHAVEDSTQLQPLLETADIIVIGPGLGQSNWSKHLWHYVIESERPTILDADALNLLALQPNLVKHCLLTPHPGEAARLLDIDTKTVQQDRFQTIMALQARYQATIVLKGCGTLIVDSKDQLFLCDKGNPAMATAGMGDVLVGVIAGLIAQGVNIGDAARLGVYLHASAGDLAADGMQRGLLATDLMSELSFLVNS